MRTATFINAESIANSVMQNKRNYQAILLVEGQSDYNFWIKFKDKNCSIIICHGNSNLISAIEILQNRGFQPIYIGIIDADFRKLDDDLPNPSLPIVLTDQHDLEILLINSDAFDKVIEWYCSETEDKKDKFLENKQSDLRSILLELALPIAYFKRVSKTEGYSFKFKATPTSKEDELEYIKFIDKQTMKFEGYEKLIKTIKDYTQRYIHNHKDKSKVNQELLIPNSDLITKINQVILQEENKWQLCNGHDFTHLISILLMKAISNYDAKKVSNKEIEEKLISYYDSTYLQKTELYNKIRDLEGQLGIKIIYFI